MLRHIAPFNILTEIVFLYPQFYGCVSDIDDVEKLEFFSRNPYSKYVSNEMIYVTTNYL